MTTSIVIVNWNSKDLLRQCLKSFYAHCKRTDVEIVVVDGGSFDGCDRMLSAEFPSVVFVQSKTNVGFARANNLGVQHTKGKYLLLLNPDTEFLEDSISILLDNINQLPNAGALGCLLLNSNRTVQTSCIQAFPTVLNQLLDSEFLRRIFPNSTLWKTRALHVSPKCPVQVEVISGACILIHRETFETIGGFDEQYFMYAEDVDLCYRIRISGRDVYYTSATSLIHHGGGSASKTISNFSNVMMRGSIYRFLLTHRGKSAAVAYRISMAINALVRLPLISLTMLLTSPKTFRNGKVSFAKWKAILRWACCLQSCSRQPEQA